MTVCPPKNSFTSLNPDLSKLEGVELNSTSRQHLTNMAVQIVQDEEFVLDLATKEKYQERDKYRNWYLGSSLPSNPYYLSKGGHNWR